MNKPLFICFTGIDGSGKSTNAKKLVKWLNKNNIPAQIQFRVTLKNWNWMKNQELHPYHSQPQPQSLLKKTGQGQALLLNKSLPHLSIPLKN